MASTRSFLALAVAAVQLAALPEPAAEASARFPRPWLIRPAPPVESPAPLPSPPDAAMANVQLERIGAKGESRTTGSASRRGALENPAQLPLEGLGYYILRPERDTHHGTDDLVAGLIEACARLKNADPGMQPLAVGDLSGPRGGRIALHLSHRSGRDADLLFFRRDMDGKPVLTDDLLRFNGRGLGRYKGEKLAFDVERNWALVKALLTNRRFGDRVVRIFVALPLKTKLIRYAERVEPRRSLVRRARWLLQEAKRPAGAHDDHLHLRIACSPRERAFGCRD